MCAPCDLTLGHDDGVGRVLGLRFPFFGGGEINCQKSLILAKLKGGDIFGGDGGVESGDEYCNGAIDWGSKYLSFV